MERNNRPSGNFHKNSGQGRAIDRMLAVQPRITAERAKHVILEEIRNSPDVRVAAAKWLTELTNEITKIVSETNQEGTR